MVHFKTGYDFLILYWYRQGIKPTSSFIEILFDQVGSSKIMREPESSLFLDGCCNYKHFHSNCQLLQRVYTLLAFKPSKLRN